MMITKRLIYSGHVQGVGFRATVLRISHRFHVKGFVRNMSSDGEVEILVQGEEAVVDAFLEQVRQTMHNYIGAIEAMEAQPIELAAFEIRY